MSRTLRFLIPGAGTLLLWLHAARYHPFLSDDALISLRYARRLLEGHGLTWTDGPPVEGYSNLLWVLLCAALGAMGLDLVLAARILGYAAGAAAIWAVARTLIRRHGVPGPALFAVLVLGLSGPLAVWAGGGLEQPLLAALLAWAVALGPATPARAGPGVGRCGPGDHPALAAVLVGLCCLTRPDGILPAAALVAGWGGARAWAPLSGVTARAEHRSAARADSLAFMRRWLLLPGASMAVAVAGQTAFRLVTYGDWLPNPAYIKLGFTFQRLLEGGSYVAGGLAWLAGLSLPALAATIPGSPGPASPAVPRAWSSRLPFILPLVAWLAYVAFIGGDFFPGRRHLAPVAVFMALLAGDLWGELRWRAWRIPAALLVLVLAVSQALDPQNRRALEERWEWDGKLVGEFLATALGDRQPLLAVDPAGCLPYFSGLPAVDMLGLNDREIARTAGRGRGWLGHEAGNGAAVLAREPDLILFCDPAGGARPCFRSGREMIHDPAFRRDYRLVTFQIQEPRPFRSRIWVRARSPRIGIQAAAGGGMTIPGYLLASGSGVTARLDGSARLAAFVPAGAAVRFGPLTLPAGDWHLRTQPAWPAPVILQPLRASGSRPGPQLAAGEALHLTGPTEVEILLGTASQAAWIRLLAVEPISPSGAPSGPHAAHGQGAKLLRCAVLANPSVPSAPPASSAVMR